MRPEPIQVGHRETINRVVTTKLRRIDDVNGGEADEITLRERAEAESSASVLGSKFGQTSGTGNLREASP